jgi:hypothetical protein
MFSTIAPKLSAQVRAVFERGGQAFGLLATVRPDGAPRVNPVSPVITSDGLFCIVALPAMSMDRHQVTAPELRRDGRYALHSGREGASDADACLLGWASPVAGPRGAPQAEGQLFEFTIAVAILTQRDPSDGRASHAVWRPP